MIGPLCVASGLRTNSSTPSSNSYILHFLSGSTVPIFASRKLITMRPIFILSLLMTCFFAQAQTDTSYRLLWYTGKKIKPGVLLTPKGDTIIYNTEKGTVRVASKAGRGKQLDKMLGELNKTSQRIQQDIAKLQVSKELQPVYSTAIHNAYTAVKERYNNALSTTLTLPALSIPVQGGKGETPIAEGFPYEETIKEFHKYYIDHATDDLKDVPVPPVFDYTYCFNCDEAGQSAYNKAIQEFTKKMFASDAAMIEKALVMTRFAQLTLGGAELQRIDNEGWRMIDFVMNRAAKRFNTLLEKYSSDPNYAPAVLQAILPTDRQMQLMGGDNPFPEGYISNLYVTISNRIQRAINEKDYSIALNLPLLLQTERTMQLFGTSDGGLLEEMIKFNQFKLNMNVSGKINAKGAYILGQVRGDNWFAAIPGKDCKLQWHLLGPLKKEAKMDLLAAEFVGAPVTYAGTKNWLTNLPSIQLDFCGGGVDSIVVYPFYPEGHQELWTYPAPMGTINSAQLYAVLTSTFMDIERLRRDANKLKDPKEVEKLKKEMAAQQASLMMQGGSPHDAITATLKMAHATDPGRYIFEPELTNKNKVLVTDKLNGKELFPQHAATEYAWFHLRLEHDPEGPYRIKLW